MCPNRRCCAKTCSAKLAKEIMNGVQEEKKNNTNYKYGHNNGQMNYLYWANILYAHKQEGERTTKKTDKQINYLYQNAIK